jgi:hypothetical protein
VAYDKGAMNSLLRTGAADIYAPVYFLFPTVGFPHPLASHVMDVAEPDKTGTV